VQRLRAEGVTVDKGRVRGLRAAATRDQLLWEPPR
jgi:methylated-DNA-protein-cysteine methyltransferase-like protein